LTKEINLEAGVTVREFIRVLFNGVPSIKTDHGDFSSGDESDEDKTDVET